MIENLKDLREKLNALHKKTNNDTMEGISFGAGGEEYEQIRNVGIVAMETCGISADQIGSPEIFDEKRYPEIKEIHELIERLFKAQKVIDKELEKKEEENEDFFEYLSDDGSLSRILNWEKYKSESERD